MNEPKYKIGQEVFRADLSKEEEVAVIVHKISEIRLREGVTEYIMFVHGYWCEEEHCDNHSYKEEDLFSTKEEAMDMWKSKIKTHKIKKLEIDIKHKTHKNAHVPLRLYFLL